jgi:hypothetical protein
VVVGVADERGVVKGVRVCVAVGTAGTDVSVGKAVGGMAVGERVGSGVGVGRLRLTVIRFSA